MDAAQCECVSELNPASKRSHVLSDARLVQESAVERDCHADDSEPVTSRQAGKENWFPRAGNWLSEMGQKMKKSQGGPSAHKKQEEKTPTSAVSKEIPSLDVNSHSCSAFRFFSFFLASCHGLLKFGGFVEVNHERKSCSAVKVRDAPIDGNNVAVLPLGFPLTI